MNETKHSLKLTDYSIFAIRMFNKGEFRKALDTIKFGFWMFVINVCKMFIMYFWHIFHILFLNYCLKISILKIVLREMTDYFMVYFNTFYLKQTYDIEQLASCKELQNSNNSYTTVETKIQCFLKIYPSILSHKVDRTIKKRIDLCPFFHH